MIEEGTSLLRILGITIFSVVNIIVYVSIIKWRFKGYKFERIYQWTANHYKKTDNVSGILLLIETILSPINILLLEATKYKTRL